MKNYKHSVKSGNAMKLAAVASAAIMMAPVALNSVTSFATTPATTTTADETLETTEGATLASYKANPNDSDSVALAKKNLNTVYANAVKVENQYKSLSNAGKNAVAKKISNYQTVSPKFTPHADIQWTSDVLSGATTASADDIALMVKGLPGTLALYASYVAAEANKEAKAEANDNAAKSDAEQQTHKAEAVNNATIAAAKNVALKQLAAAKSTLAQLSDAEQNSTKGNILKGAISKATTDIAAGKTVNDFASVSSTLAEAVKNVTTTNAVTSVNQAKKISDQLIALSKKLAATSNMSTKSSIQAEINALVAQLTAKKTTIADTPNMSTEASKKAEAAAKAAEAAKQAVIDALNQQIKGLEAEKATTTNKSTLASLNAQIVALNTRINELKGNTIASTPNMSTEASKKAEAAAKQNNRFTGIAHINYAKGYGIQVWTKDHKIVKNADGSAKKLGGETNWKVFGGSVNIDGKNMYCVGGNQYVDAAYVTLTHSVNLDK